MRSLLTVIAAAVLLALSGSAAPASSLPRRAAAPAPVPACDAFGPGFVPVAGSDTCIRVSGSVGFEARLRSGSGTRDVGAFMAAPRR